MEKVELQGEENRGGEKRTEREGMMKFNATVLCRLETVRFQDELLAITLGFV